MCHIITDPSDTVQRMAYKMLKESAVKYTEYLVLEAGVDSEAEVKLELPLELIELLQMSLSDEDAEDPVGRPQVGIAHLRKVCITLTTTPERLWISACLDVDIRPLCKRCMYPICLHDSRHSRFL